MTFRETAAAMRKMADIIDQVVKTNGDGSAGTPKPMLEDDAAAGAAIMLCYIRDLVTVGGREVYDRGTLLVVLETISRDQEIFPAGIGQLVWQAEDEEDGPA